MLFLPVKAKNPPDHTPYLTYSLIAVNCAVYLATTDYFLVVRESAVKKLALRLADFSPITLLTHMFLHAEILHLAGNMLFLFIFGQAVEGRLRAGKFALMYFASGLIGACAHILFMGRLNPDIPMLGASGAIMGVMGAALYMFPFSPVKTIWGFFMYYSMVEIPMWGVGLYFVGFDILLAVLSGSTGGGTAHLAHIGGVTAGFLIAMMLRTKRDSLRASQAKSIVSDFHHYLNLDPGSLAELASLQPDNTEIALCWMRANVLLGLQPGDCVAHFRKNFRAIVKETEPQLLGECMAVISRSPDVLTGSMLVNLGLRMEQAKDAAGAKFFLESARMAPGRTASDMETATFWLGSIAEQWYRQPGLAVQYYREFMQRYPMSPLAGEVRVRLDRLERVVQPRARS
ncbi:MAG: rhomboid family intramembrane serine protease [Armatimonadetes bacterium]|nr:rhomboid family intramembrane serine protease [Armatimonadota bacterium]